MRGHLPHEHSPTLPAAAKALKACDGSHRPRSSHAACATPSPTPTATSSTTWAGHYMAGGKSDLCSAPDKGPRSRLYAGLLKDYGPPGVVNYTFNQISALYRTGRAAMAFESTNEFPAIMEGDTRDERHRHRPPARRVPAAASPRASAGVSPSPPTAASKGPAWYLVQWATSPAVQAELARRRHRRAARQSCRRPRIQGLPCRQADPPGMAARGGRNRSHGQLGSRLPNSGQPGLAQPDRAIGRRGAARRQDGRSGLRRRRS